MGFGEYLKRNGGVFASFFAVAALLPVLILGVTNPGSLKLMTQADEATELRLWLEPERATVKAGQTAIFRVMAQYDKSTGLIPKLEMILKGGEGVELDQKQVMFGRPFSGLVEVGKVRVRGKNAGVYRVEIVENSVNTTLADLEVVTQEAQLSVE